MDSADGEAFGAEIEVEVADGPHGDPTAAIEDVEEFEFFLFASQLCLDHGEHFGREAFEFAFGTIANPLRGFDGFGDAITDREIEQSSLLRKQLVGGTRNFGQGHGPGHESNDVTILGNIELSAVLFAFDGMRAIDAEELRMQGSCKDLKVERCDARAYRQHFEKAPTR